MSKEIFDCLKRERDICVEAIIPSQKPAFMLTPALRVKKAVLVLLRVSSFKSSTARAFSVPFRALNRKKN